jgi:hypothetical protein
MREIKRRRNCKNCDKKLIRTDNIYCNIGCYQEYQFKNKYLPLFYLGEIRENKTLRKILIYLYGNKCSECPCESIWNGKPLVMQVDHKDGNSDNNMPENVRLLCPNCHTQTPTFCAGDNKQTRRNKYLRKYKNSMLL